MSPVLRHLCPGCRVVLIASPARRCPACQRAHERARGSRIVRGYGAHYQRVRVFVLERDGYCCRWCGGPASTVDHVVPLVRGGPSTEANLVAACRACNSRRGGQGR